MMTGFGCKVIAYDLCHNPQCEAIAEVTLENITQIEQEQICKNEI